MKKTAAILFASILLFNLYGYKLLLNWRHIAEEVVLQDQIINNDFNEEDLISIKVATVLPPYISASEKYEWKDGEVVLNKTIYKYVKRKIFKDSIEFLCLPHPGKMNVESAREQFMQLCFDFQNAPDQNNSNHHSLVKPFTYEATSIKLLFLPLQELTLAMFFNDLQTPHLPQRFLSAVSQPPETIS